MAGYIYDIAKLQKPDVIDAETAVKRFFGELEYFHALDVFIEKSKNYLREYTPSAVIDNEEVRENFLDESKKIKIKLFSLGMVEMASTMSELDDEAGSGNEETLSGSLQKFYAQIDDMVKFIDSERTVIEAAGQNNERPVILAVDDKPELLTAIVEMLEGHFKVMAVTSGKTALNLIKRHTPKLFLLDIEMPQMNGYELAKMIRRQKRFEIAPIVFLTGKNTRDDVIKAIKNGGNDYLLKPIEKDLLIEKIKKHLEEM